MEDGQLLRKTLTSHWWDMAPLEAKLFITLYWFADPDSQEAIFSPFSLSQKVNTKTKEILPYLERLRLRGLIEFTPGKNFLLDSRFKILCKNEEFKPIFHHNDIDTENDHRIDSANLKIDTMIDIESDRLSEKKQPQTKKNSPLTAEFLAQQFGDEANLTLYESYLHRYSQDIIRKAYEIVSQTPPDRIKKTPGAYFNYLVKKYANKES